MVKTRKIPSAPKKAPPKFILPSSRFYTNNNNNNLTPENLNVKEVNLTPLVEAVKKNPGNKPIPYHHPNLNLQVPKLKLPPHLQGGKRTRRARRRGSRKQR